MNNTLHTLTLTLLALVGFSLTGCASGTKTAREPGPDAKTVLLVLTNHGELGDTGEPTGFYLPEAAHPWAVFRDAGWRVTLASPAGGEAPVDPRSLEDADEESIAFLDTFATGGGDTRVVPDTIGLRRVEATDYDAVYFAGGHGTMWDFERDLIVPRIASRVYNNGGVVAAVCHGPAALVNARVGGGWLLDGKTVTGFTNAEEEAVGLTEAMPFLLETRMTERGATFEGAGNFEEHVVADGRLVTGQNPASARGVAERVVKIAD